MKSLVNRSGETRDAARSLAAISAIAVAALAVCPAPASAAPPVAGVTDLRYRVVRDGFEVVAPTALLSARINLVTAGKRDHRCIPELLTDHFVA